MIIFGGAFLLVPQTGGFKVYQPDLTLLNESVTPNGGKIIAVGDLGGCWLLELAGLDVNVYQISMFTGALTTTWLAVATLGAGAAGLSPVGVVLGDVLIYVDVDPANVSGVVSTYDLVGLVPGPDFTTNAGKRALEIVVIPWDGSVLILWDDGTVLRYAGDGTLTDTYPTPGATGICADTGQIAFLAFLWNDVPNNLIKKVRVSDGTLFSTVPNERFSATPHSFVTVPYSSQIGPL